MYAVRFEIAGQTIINQLALSSRAKASQRRAEVEGPESWVSYCFGLYASLRSLHSAAALASASVGMTKNVRRNSFLFKVLDGIMINLHSVL